jgi:hypothetical protein
MGHVRGGRRLLLCEKCKKVVETSREQLLNYTQTSWPKCCGEVMLFFIEFEPPEQGMALPGESSFAQQPFRPPKT